MNEARGSSPADSRGQVSEAAPAFADVTTTERPTAHADADGVLLKPPADWRTGEPMKLSPDAARDLAGELLEAAVTASAPISS